MRAVLARLKGSGSDVERWQGRIPEVQQPTLIIWGAHDTWIEPENADRFHRDIRGSRLVMIPGCGHLPQEETPGEFVASVLDFMAGIEREIVITEMPACPAPETSAAGLTI